MEVRGQFCRVLSIPLHGFVRLVQQVSAWTHFISYFPVAVIRHQDKAIWANGFMGMRVHHHPNRETRNQAGTMIGTPEHFHHKHREPIWNGTSNSQSPPPVSWPDILKLP